MRLRHGILLSSGLAVVGDAVLIAFYPQFFAQRFGIVSAFHVGAYVAAISIVVMCTLPLWARVARHVGTLRLLPWTQAAAGLLCVAAAAAGSPQAFWVCTLAMFACRSSTLLLFPTLMRHEPPSSHAPLVGLLAVLVHLGGIGGAAAGGWLLQRHGPLACLALMAACDFAQMAVCLGLRGAESAAPPPAQPRASSGLGGVLRLGLVMAVFDFSAYLTRPFFALHWERLSGSGPAIAGLVFALPGLMALIALAANRRARRFDRAAANLLLGAAGLALQAAPAPALVLAGRCLYGWALFQVVVKLEVSVFRVSTPEAYAGHYSLTNACQNVGVLLSSFAAGALVARHGVAITFAIGAAGFLLTALLDRLMLRVDELPSTPPTTAKAATHAT